jgi:hypothetical protein
MGISMLFNLYFRLIDITVNAQIPTYISKDSLGGLWPYNGNANDESINGIHGTVLGAFFA